MSELGLLPDGWALTDLGGIISISSGKGLTKSKMVEGDIPVFGGNGITGWHNDTNINKVTIAIGRVGFYCGSVHLTPAKAWITDNAFVTSFDDGSINQKFLYQLLTNTDLRQNDSSTAQPVISGAKVYPIGIHLPPLAEQKVIADKLDELLAQVESTKARLDAIPAILKSFRQSLLAAAVSGKLTEEWRGSNKYEIQGNKLLPVGWKSEPASMVCLKVQSGSTPRDNPFDQNGTIPFLKVYNIVNQKIDFDYKPQFVTADVHKSSLKRSIAQPNDVLMNIVGPPLGKVAVLTDQYPEWNLNQAITLFRADPSALHHLFLYHVLCEGELVREVMPDTKGSVGQVNISLSQCRDALLPIPPLNEQIEIVRRVEELFAFADKVETQVNAAQLRVNNLTQSILAKAFRGELTADWRTANPSLISGDNSAEALLERIKAEREVLATKKKPTKKASIRKKA
ncbi:restriction endonuclease subunit S [Shewanella sp. HL-SH4]|uniref:restriction endonuclease subunit S n=1 Tax=Shewanella sp. HL-SH4 TaxID=3436240 RepID=UPI003EBCE59C